MIVTLLKNSIPFSPQEIDSIVEQLETIMVDTQRTTVDEREALQAFFPTLSRARMDDLLSEEPLTPDVIVQRTKELIQFLIGKTYQ